MKEITRWAEQNSGVISVDFGWLTFLVGQGLTIAFRLPSVTCSGGPTQGLYGDAPGVDHPQSRLERDSIIGRTVVCCQPAQSIILNSISSLYTQQRDWQYRAERNETNEHPLVTAEIISYLRHDKMKNFLFPSKSRFVGVCSALIICKM